tara:strand:+ start:2083 stop:2286 length:204 start_codon:yes stop_codon:yes gene_type:complete
MAKKEIKGKKIYNLEICYNDSTSEIEYIYEFIEGSEVSCYYGNVDMAEYWDTETLDLIDVMNEVGET